MTQGRHPEPRRTQHILELENGNTYRGQGFGADATVAGEVVFNTGMRVMSKR